MTDDYSVSSAIIWMFLRGRISP